MAPWSCVLAVVALASGCKDAARSQGKATTDTASAEDSKDASLPPKASCKQAADHVRDQFAADLRRSLKPADSAANDGYLNRTADQIGELAVSSCEKDKWSDNDIACVLRASTEEALDDCRVSPGVISSAQRRVPKVALDPGSAAMPLLTAPSADYTDWKDIKFDQTRATGKTVFLSMKKAPAAIDLDAFVARGCGAANGVQMYLTFDPSQLALVRAIPRCHTLSECERLDKDTGCVRLHFRLTGSRHFENDEGQLLGVMDVNPKQPSTAPPGVDIATMDDLYLAGNDAVGKMTAFSLRRSENVEDTVDGYACDPREEEVSYTLKLRMSEGTRESVKNWPTGECRVVLFKITSILGGEDLNEGSSVGWSAEIAAVSLIPEGIKAHRGAKFKRIEQPFGSLVVPDGGGWKRTEVPDGALLVFTRKDGATLKIAYQDKVPLDQHDDFIDWALQSYASGTQKVGRVERGAVGLAPATRIETTSVREGSSFVTRVYVVLLGGRAVILECSMPDDEAARLPGFIDYVASTLQAK